MQSSVEINLCMRAGCLLIVNNWKRCYGLSMIFFGSVMYMLDMLGSRSLFQQTQIQRGGMSSSRYRIS